MISRTYKNNLQQFTELLNAANIPYCVMAGTLLGAIRNCDFIEHDEDIDITISAQYKKQVEELIADSGWHYYAYWRREFGIVRHNYTKADSKIDIFFYDSDNKFSYIYSYKKNPMHGRWDIEWRMKFPVGVFDKVKKWRMGEDTPIYIPERYEEILNIEYGPDWRTPNAKWNTYNTPGYDKNHRAVAIIIPTFIRDEKLTTLIESIKKTYHNEWYRIYIADQGLYTPTKDASYKKLRKQGHFATFLPFNCGLSYCRNYLVNQTKEPFILVLDDDFLITTKTDLGKFIAILDSNSEIGVVGGMLDGHQEYHYDLFHDVPNNKLYYIHTHPRKQESTWKTVVQPKVEFLYKDIVLNFAMFRREMFEDIRWDNDLKLCEHTDFYLRVKKLNKWRVAFTKSVITNHQITANSNEYIEYRRSINNKGGLEIFLKKWKFSNEQKDFIYLKED